MDWQPMLALMVLIALGIAVDSAVKLVRSKRRPGIDAAQQRRRFALALAAFLALALAFLSLFPGDNVVTP